MELLLLTDWGYPCDHQFLNKVYAENLVEREYNITWVMRPASTDQKSVRHHTWNGCDVYVLPSSAYNPARTALNYVTGRIQSHVLFETEISFDEFDLIHVRNDLSMGLLATQLKSEYQIPYAHQISHCKAEALIEAAEQGFESRSAWIKGQLGKRLRRYVANSADVLLPISKAMERHLTNDQYTTPMEVLPTGAKVVEDIPSGEQFKQKYNIDSDYLLIYMGSMSPYRNLEFLFDVLAVVSKRHDVELAMVGGRSEQDRTRLQEQAVEKGVASQVTFTGWISNRDLLQSGIAAADIGLSPFPTDSILRTNAPIKTLEYMSMETPVVTSDTPDQKKVLDESDAGFAVKYAISEFSDAIDQLLSSTELMSNMGKEGREFLNKNRNFDKLTSDTERIYKKYKKSG